MSCVRRNTPPNPSRPRRRSRLAERSGLGWRRESARGSPLPDIPKTAENDDDEDEKDWEMALFCQGPDGFERLFDPGGPWKTAA